MKYIVSINDKNYEVEVERGEAQIIKTTKAIQIETPASAVPSSPPAGSAQIQANLAQSVASVDGEPIKAPLPGMILAVKTSAGAVVKRGEILLILEAMKMENEIVAPKDGMVSQLLVGKGSTVGTGDILVVIK